MKTVKEFAERYNLPESMARSLAAGGRSILLTMANKTILHSRFAFGPDPYRPSVNAIAIRLRSAIIWMNEAVSAPLDRHHFRRCCCL